MLFIKTSFFKDQLIKTINITNTANRGWILSTLVLFTLLISPLNNQEIAPGKNLMAQIQLEFQKLRAKNNLCATSELERTAITESNCPALYQVVAEACYPDYQRLHKRLVISKLVPAIYVTKKLKTSAHSHREQLGGLKYDYYAHSLTIDQAVLDTLTLPELKALIAHEINFGTINAKYHLDNQRSGWKNFFKGLGLGLIAPLLALLVLPAILALKFATKQTIQWIPLGTTLLFAGLLAPIWFFTILPCGHTPVLFALTCTQFALVFIAVEIVICLIAYYHYKTKTTAKFSEVTHTPYCPDPALVSASLTKLAQHWHINHVSTSYQDWLTKRRNHLGFVHYGYQKQQTQAAQAAAAME